MPGLTCRLSVFLGSLWFAAAPLAAKESAAVRDFTEVSPAELRIVGIEEKRDPKTGFMVGGKNATAAIRSLTELNGRTIAELEREMRPGAASDMGFLGPQESLLEVLAADNRLVVEERGLTHQQLARALRLLAAIGRKQSGEPFLYRGQRFRVTLQYYRGFQESPFDDGTKACCEATVENLASGQRLEYSLLVPDMIERYGFYEGRGTPYRVAPAQILEVCDFLAEDDFK